MIAQREDKSTLFIKKSAIFSIAGPLYLLFAFLRFYIENSLVSNMIAALSGMCGMIFLAAAAMQKPRNPAIYNLVLAFCLLGLFILPFDRNEIIQVLPQFIAHLGYAWALLYAKHSQKVTSILLLSLIIFFYFQIFLGINPENIFTISRNYISVITILSIALYVFACHQNGKMPSLTLLLMAMAVFLWAIGRAGILSGAIILFGVLLLSKRHFVITLLLVAVSWIAVSIFQPSFLASIGDFTVGLERFERLSGQSQRQVINSEYIESIGTYLSDLIIGAPLGSLPSVQQVDGNPHNAFISLHIAFGIFGFIIFWIALSTSMFHLIKKRKYLLILMLLVAVFRSIFDLTAFHGPMDVVIFYCIFSGLKCYRQRPKFQEYTM